MLLPRLAWKEHLMKENPSGTVRNNVTIDARRGFSGWFFYSSVSWFLGLCASEVSTAGLVGWSIAKPAL